MRGEFYLGQKTDFLNKMVAIKKLVYDGVPSQWGYSTKFCTGRLCSKVPPQKRYPFQIPSFDKWYPFHIPSLELCIPYYNCCKCNVY